MSAILPRGRSRAVKNQRPQKSGSPSRLGSDQETSQATGETEGSKKRFEFPKNLAEFKSQIPQFRPIYCVAFLMSALVIALLVIHEIFAGYDLFRDDLDRNWGFLLLRGEAPVWLNEFGTGRPGRWWTNMIRYMTEMRLDFAYWSIDGQKEPGKADSYGLLQKNYRSYSFITKMLDLVPDLQYVTVAGYHYPVGMEPGGSAPNMHR